MKRIRLLALFMALCLMFGTLTACGNTAAGSTSAASGTVVDDSAIPAEALEDAVSYLTDGVYTADTVVATCGDQEVTAGELLYWAAYQYYYMSYYYAMYGYTMDVSSTNSDGTTMAQSLIDDALDSAVGYAACRQKANDLGVELSEDTQNTLATFYDDNVEYYGETRWTDSVDAGLINEDDFTDDEKAEWITDEGTRFYLHSMAYFSSTEEQYYNLAENSYYYGLMKSTMLDEGGTYAPTEATMSDYLQSYIEDNGICWARCILFSTTDCADDDAVAEVKAQADAAYEELSALSGDELSARFTELQEEYDTSGYTAGEVQMYTSSDSLVDGYYDGIEELEAGQVGMTGQTDYGYFILLREEDSTDDIYDDAYDQYTSDTMDSLVLQWRSDYGVTKTRDFTDIDLIEYFENLQTLQDLIADTDAIVAPEDETTEDAATSTSAAASSAAASASASADTSSAG